MPDTGWMFCVLLSNGTRSLQCIAMIVKILKYLVLLTVVFLIIPELSKFDFASYFRKDPLQFIRTKNTHGYVYSNEDVVFSYPKRLRYCGLCHRLPQTSHYRDEAVEITVMTSNQLRPRSYKRVLSYPDSDEEMDLRLEINECLKADSIVPSNENLDVYLEVDSVLHNERNATMSHFYTVNGKPFCARTVIEEGLYRDENLTIYHT